MGRKEFRSNPKWSHLNDLPKTKLAFAVKMVEFGKLRKQGGSWSKKAKKKDKVQGILAPCP